MLWDLILKGFSTPGTLFLWFLRVLETGWNFDGFQDPPKSTVPHWLGVILGFGGPTEQLAICNQPLQNAICRMELTILRKTGLLNCN